MVSLMANRWRYDWNQPANSRSFDSPANTNKHRFNHGFISWCKMDFTTIHCIVRTPKEELDPHIHVRAGLNSWSRHYLICFWLNLQNSEEPRTIPQNDGSVATVVLAPGGTTVEPALIRGYPNLGCGCTEGKQHKGGRIPLVVQGKD